jgi:catechol 2,3-dioxygenase-like lactoylglutathione lyase family enzyme
MNSQFGHLQVNVEPGNLGFYRDLLQFLEWTPYADSDEMVGFGDANGASVWFGKYGSHLKPNDYDGAGVNHIAFSVAAQADVDAAANYLADKGVAALFDTPRHRPEFGMGEGQTYYQVMFKSPDNLLFEVVYTGPKAD